MMDIDADADGTIDFAESLAVLIGKMEEKGSREDIEKVFMLFDDDNIRGYPSATSPACLRSAERTSMTRSPRHDRTG